MRGAVPVLHSEIEKLIKGRQTGGNMKPTRIVLGLALLLALLGGIYWRVKSPPTPNPVAGTNDSPKTAAVAQPVIGPVSPVGGPAPVAVSVMVNGANATVLAANHQETLNSLLKFQTELEQSLAASTDAQEREALQQELDHLQIQIQFEINASATRPVIASNLGEIALMEGQSRQRKLASGDVATFTSATAADGTWTVNVIVRHTDKGGATSDESTTVTTQSGQTADIKVTGNEIHFTPMTGSASSK